MITVCIPTLNAMPYLSEAVESVLAQTYFSFCFLIINDGSTDGTREYLDSIEGSDSRLTIIHQENRGLGATLNRSIELCETPYYARMDADDIMMPDRLKKQMSYLDQHQDVVILGTAVDFIAGEKRIPGSRPPLKHDDIVNTLMGGHSGVTHPTIVFKAEVARRIGGYRISGSGEDVDFCLRMSDEGRMANLPDMLHQMRIHEGSISFRDQADLRRGYDYARVCAECRRANMKEPEWEVFAHEWAKNRSWFSRVRDHLEAASTKLYRRALIDQGSGHPVRGRLRMAVAAAMRPGSVARRLKTKLTQ